MLFEIAFVMAKTVLFNFNFKDFYFRVCDPKTIGIPQGVFLLAVDLPGKI